MGEGSGALCGDNSGGCGGASRRLRVAVEEGILGLRGFRALRLKPIRIWIFDGIGNRLIPAGDFFLEKKQKRARCSGLQSRFILCRTCRAKAACLGGISVCTPGRRRGILFEYCAARLNPALALRMRA